MDLWVLMNIKYSWKKSIFSGGQMFATLEDKSKLWGQVKQKQVKQIFFILKTLVPLWPSYKFPCLYPTSGIFGHSQDFTSDWLLANKWAQEGSHWFSQYEVVSACLHHTIFRGWAFQIHNFNFLFLFQRVNCNKL